MEMMIRKIFILIAMVKEQFQGNLFSLLLDLFSLYRTYGMDTDWKSSNEGLFLFKE
jgi:hypothetical protein